MSEVTHPPLVLQRADHNISRRDISEATVKVLYRLQRAGFEGLLVGGAVRDLLVGRRPKDFDVATNARPEQVRRIFRNSRIIGRRFRLVHVMFEGEVVEVATFRADPDPRRQRGGEEEILVTNDNTYGTPEQDAYRRDFTVNGLFYRLKDFSVVDYVGGLADLDEGLVRLIGDPAVRFLEDPVRMLRACEFSARLGFEIEERTMRGIRRHRQEILKASPARLIEELLQLLTSGAAHDSLEWAQRAGLLEVLLPEASEILDHEIDDEGFGDVISVLDEWTREERPLSDTVLLGSLLAPGVLRARTRLEGRKQGIDRDALALLSERAVAGLGSRFVISGWRASRLLSAFDVLHRLCEPIPEDPRARWRIVSDPAFSEALLLFELLSEASGEGTGVYDQWLAESKSTPPPKRRRRRRRR